MKKILLATTMLTLTAGYAVADITWAGSATAGVARNGGTKAVPANDDKTAKKAAKKAVAAAQAAYDIAFAGFSDGSVNAGELATAQTTLEDAKIALAALGGGPATPDGDFATYSSVNLAATFAGQTDGGLTFGATFDMTSGVEYNFADDDTFSTASGTFGTPSVFISGTFGKLTISTDNIGGLDGDETDDGNYDAQYDGTFGPATVSVQADMETGLMGIKGAFATGAFSGYAIFSQQDLQDDIWDVSATYTFGAVAVTASTDNQQSTTILVAYTGANGISASAAYNSNTGADDASYDITGGYTANGLSVSAEVDDVSGENGDMTWTVEASYDLGGGLSVGAGTNYTDDVYVGATMSF